MKKQFEKLAKKHGFEILATSSRPEFSSVIWVISIRKDGELVDIWDSGYFIGETGTANSKEKLLPDFEEHLRQLSCN